MKSLLNFLKPAPMVEEIADEAVVKSEYKYWRIRIFYSIFVGYALYYFTRKSFTFAIPALVTELGLDKAQIGILGSIFAITYGLSKFASGILSDRSNPRYFMAFGLILTGIFNILFGFSSSLYFFAIFWGLNALFQGFGWPPCARFLTHWYSHSERGSWWSTWNISHNIGASLIPWIAGFFIYYFDWRYAMYFPGVICILGGLFLINRLRDTPQSLGLPPIEKFRNDYPTKNGEIETERELTTKEILVDHVLKNKYIWVLSIAYLFIYFVRNAVDGWTVLYLSEHKGYSIVAASGNLSVFEIGGIFGALAAGWGSDKIFGAKRGPVNALFAIGILASILFFWSIPPGYQWLDTIAIFLLGVTIFGPQMMIGIAAAELATKKAAATATGFAGYFAYMGAAIAGYPLGRVTQDWGWNGFFWFMIGCSIVSILLLLPLWNVTQASMQKSKKPNIAPPSDATIAPAK